MTLAALRQQCTFTVPRGGWLDELWSIPGVHQRDVRGQVRITVYPDLVPWLSSLFAERLGPAGTSWSLAVPDAVTAALQAQHDLARGEELLATCPDLRETIDSAKPFWQWLVAFQRRDLTRALALDGLHFWQAPGAGKTPEQIAALVAGYTPALPESGLHEAGLVVTIAPVRWQYAGELRRFTTLEPYVLSPWSPPLGKYLERFGPVRYGGQLRFRKRRPIIIASWTDLVDWREDLLLLAPEGIVFDESHRGKSTKREDWAPSETGRPQARKRVNMGSVAFELACRARRVFPGTGTQVFNTLEDLWGQLTLLQPHAWGRTATRFKFRYCDAHSYEGHGGLDASGTSNEAELRSRIGVCAALVTEAEAKADLPPLIRTPVYVPAGAQNRAGAFTEEIRRAAKDVSPEGAHRRLHLEVAYAASCIRDYAVDYIIAECLEKGHRVLVLDVWRENCIKFYERLRAKWRDAVTADDDPDLLRQNLWLVLGGNDKLRHAVHCRVQGMEGVAPLQGPGVVVGTWAELATGLNWHACHDGAAIGLPYTGGMLQQGDDRLHRRGLDHPVRWLYFIAEGTYAERVVEILLRKLPGMAAAGADPDGVRAAARAIEGVEGHEEALDAQLQAALAASTAEPD